MLQAQVRSTPQRRSSTSKPLAFALRRTTKTMCVLVFAKAAAARVAAVGIGALHGKYRLRELQNALATIAVPRVKPESKALDIGAVNLHREQPTVGVGQDVALASADLLAGVVALRAPL